MDRETGRGLRPPNGTMGHRYAQEDQGKWNLDLQGRKPILSIRDLPQGQSAAVEIKMPTFDNPKGHGDVITRGVPVTYVDGHEVTTVFDIMLAQYGVGREGLPGTWAKDYEDWNVQNTPGMGRSRLLLSPPRLLFALPASSPRAPWIPAVAPWSSSVQVFASGTTLTPPTALSSLC